MPAALLRLLYVDSLADIDCSVCLLRSIWEDLSVLLSDVPPPPPPPLRAAIAAAAARDIGAAAPAIGALNIYSKSFYVTRFFALIDNCSDFFASFSSKEMSSFMT